MVWSAGWSFLRAEGVSCSLDVLHGCLGINKLKFLKESFNFFSAVTLKLLVINIQTLDPDPHWLKIQDSDPHWNQCGSTTLLEKFSHSECSDWNLLKIFSSELTFQGTTCKQKEPEHSFLSKICSCLRIVIFFVIEFFCPSSAEIKSTYLTCSFIYLMSDRKGKSWVHSSAVTVWLLQYSAADRMGQSY
jgi:hypothetical protein